MRRAILLTLTLICVPPVEAGEPSAEYQAMIRKTMERRRERRRRSPEARPGRIVPWPMPPALVIRQTPGAHDEIDGLLRALRGR